jgi:hypothetical protein
MAQEQTFASYLSAAQALFNILKQDYQDNDQARVFMGSTNYWMAGNVFDTSLDYMLLALANKLITPEEVQSVMNYVVKNYDVPNQTYNAGYGYYVTDNGTKGDHGMIHIQPAEPKGWWYDDLAWWGIATSKVYLPEYQVLFNNLISPYQKIARSCWDVMNNGFPADPGRPIQYGAPFVWAKCDQSLFGQYEPRIPGGVWQCDINLNEDPGYEKLGPFQNTVVNALYFVLALRMNKAINTTQQIESEYNFLNTWCNNINISPNNRLYYDLSTKPGPWEGLIEERVATYKNGQPVNPPDWHNKHCAWCGDQGLMIGGLLDYLNLHPQNPDASNLILGILNGVPNHMQSGTVLMPWYPLIPDNPLAETDKADYASGVGVYMRYLLYGYRNDPTIKYIVDKNMYGLRNMVLNNANACVAGKFPTYGNGIFDLFNQLSILITASYVLQGAEAQENGAEKQSVIELNGLEQNIL